MDDEVTFTPWEGDPSELTTCGECRVLVPTADMAHHRRYHQDLSRVVLAAIRKQAQREGRRLSF